MCSSENENTKKTSKLDYIMLIITFLKRSPKISVCQLAKHQCSSKGMIPDLILLIWLHAFKVAYRRFLYQVTSPVAVPSFGDSSHYWAGCKMSAMHWEARRRQSMLDRRLSRSKQVSAAYSIIDQHRRWNLSGHSTNISWVCSTSMHNPFKCHYWPVLKQDVELKLSE